MDTTKDVQDAIRTTLTSQKIDSDYVDKRLNDGTLDIEDGTFRFKDSSGLNKAKSGSQLAKAAAGYIAQTTPEEHRDVENKRHIKELTKEKRESGDYRL